MMYEEFAVIYDSVMSEIPYDKWFDDLHGCLKRLGKDGGHICEIGCGTGEMTTRFANAGYEVTGIDLSPDMLARAEHKKGNRKILYLNQDMADFTLHKPADVVLCICDSINYQIREEDLLATFQCVCKNLADGGIFLFDVKTEYCYEHILGDSVRFQEGSGYAVVWENAYDREKKINEYLLTMFICRDEPGLYERHEEYHSQRMYSRNQIYQLLREAGMTLHACYGGGLEKEPGAEEERIYFVAGKEGQ